MKMLCILNNGYREAGGVEMTVADITGYLSQNGHEARVLSGDRVFQNGTKFSNYEFPALPSTGVKKVIYTAFNFGAYKALRKTLKEFKPDVVMVHTTYQSTAAIFPALRGYPTILFVHGPELYLKPWIRWHVPSRYYRHGRQGDLTDLSLVGCMYYVYYRFLCSPIYRIGFRNIDQVVALSSFTDEFLEKEGIRALRMPNGINLYPYKPLDGNSRVILYVGRLESYKGVDDLIKSIPPVMKSFPDATVRIAGGGNYRNELEKLVEKLELQGHVTFLGQLNREQLETEYTKSALLVMPSAYPETFGKVGVEALSIGRPVIATDVGGVRDWLRDGVNGYLIRPQDSSEIAEKIISVLGNAAATKKMSIAARKTAEEFSIFRFADSVEHEARKLLRTKQK